MLGYPEAPGAGRAGVIQYQGFCALLALFFNFLKSLLRAIHHRALKPDIP
jgi:hypothetical protein